MRRRKEIRLWVPAAVLALGSISWASAGPLPVSDSDFFRQLAPAQDIASRELDLLRQGRKSFDSILDMERRGMGFPAIFRALCQNALRSKASPSAALRELFAGLLLWTKSGGRPVLLGREDWALHFIYGGRLASLYGTVAGETAGYHKELKDAFTPGNGFDLDDLAVTILGARLAGRAELKSWAEGTKSLETLPSLSFGILPPQKIPSGRQLEAVSKWVDSALDFFRERD